MKPNIINKVISAAAILVAAFVQTSCENDIETPNQFVKITNQTSITVPNGGAQYTLEIESNSAWQVLFAGDDISWISATPLKGSGNGSTVVKIDANIGADAVRREATVKVAMQNNPHIYAELPVSQNAPAAPGTTMTVAELRALATNITTDQPIYTITENVKVVAFVNSDITAGNFRSNAFAMQDSTEPGSGIVLQGAAPFSYEAGDEVEIGILGSTLYRDGNGILVLKPASDGRVVLTDTSNTPQSPVSIDVATLKGGTYESMYVGIPSVEVTLNYLDGIMEGAVQMEDKAFEKFTMYTYPSCNFATEDVSGGCGTLKGIASAYEGECAVLPCNTDDFSLTEQRFGKVGIKLPYVFSFKCAGTTNDAGMTYSTWTTLAGVPLVFGTDKYETNREIFHTDDMMVTPDDNTGIVMTFSLTGVPKDMTSRVAYWHEGSGHHNLPTRRWNTNNYAQLEVPLAEDVDGRIRLSFGISSSGSSPKDWKVVYSTDLTTWKDAENTFSIPKGKNVGGGKHFFYASMFITLESALPKGSMVYFRIMPASSTNLTGDPLNSGVDSRFHSAIVWDKQPKTTTPTPAGALYFEPFDHIFGGLDYMLGDKLAGMIAYCGTDISTWNDTQKAGLTGTNVRERTGYVQIGYADNLLLAPNAITNSAGSLTTPALSEISGTANVKVTFKAVSFKTGISSGYVSPKENINGDITSVVVSVSGGGTISGGTETSTTVSGLNHSAFKDFSVDIDGATPETKITFTSDPATGEFSRWMIDDICVTAR